MIIVQDDKKEKEERIFSFLLRDNQKDIDRHTQGTRCIRPYSRF